MRCQFTRDTEVLYQDRVLRIVDSRGQTIRVVDPRFGKEEEFDRRVLVAAHSGGQLRFALPEGIALPAPGLRTVPLVADLDRLPAHVRTKVETRITVVEKLRTVDRTRLAFAAALGELARQGVRVPNLSKAYEWLKLYEEAGCDQRALIPKTYLRKGLRRYHPHLITLIEETIKRDYLNRERGTIRQVALAVKAAADAYNEAVVLAVGGDPARVAQGDLIPVPSLKALAEQIRREVEKIDGRTKMRRRVGDKEAAREYSAPRRTRRPMHIMAEVELDSTVLDLFVVDKNGNPIGRPTLTTAWDRASGRCIGKYLGWEPPSIQSLMYCLRDAMRSKDYLKKLYPGIKHDWDCYGLIDLLIVDNGLELHSDALRNACRRLVIDLMFLPIGMPWWKGRLEREFRTMTTRLLPGVPGRAFANPEDRGPYDPEKHAKISPAALSEFVLTYLVDIQPFEYHSGIRGRPVDVWTTKFEEHPPALPPNDDELLVFLQRTARRTLQPSGIHFLRYTYNDACLTRLRAREDLASLEVEFTFDPGNLGRIWVWEPPRVGVHAGRYLEVPADGDDAEGTSFFERRVQLREMSAEEDVVDESYLAERYAHGRSILERDAAATTSAQRAATRAHNKAVKEAKAAGVKPPKKPKGSVKERRKRARVETSGADFKDLPPGTAAASTRRPSPRNEPKTPTETMAAAPAATSPAPAVAGKPVLLGAGWENV